MSLVLHITPSPLHSLPPFPASQSSVAIDAVAHRCQRGGTQDLSLPVLTPHRSLHEDLRPYGPLMGWLKEVNAETFDKLCQVCMCVCVFVYMCVCVS